MNLSIDLPNGAVTMHEDGEASIEVGSIEWDLGDSDTLPISFEHDDYSGVDGTFELSPDEAESLARNILASLDVADS